MSPKRLLALIIFFALSWAKPLWAGEADASKVQWEKTLTAAREEGRLVVHMSPTANVEKVVQAFRQKFPEIQLATAVDRAGRFALRIMTERRAGKYLWDLCLCGPTAPYNVLLPAKALDPVRSHLILPEVLDESKWWGGKHHYVDPENQYIFVFIGTVGSGSVFYNKNLVQPSEFHSYGDLLHPKWKGKILALDPRAPGPQRAGVRGLYHIPELGPKFLRRLFGEMNVTLSRDERQAADWLVVGRFSICLFCADAVNARNQGLPVDEFETVAWKETPTVSPGGTGSIILLNRAPHPNAAKVFINWLLSPEGQVIYQKFVNTTDTTAESMRIDIPKDPIPPMRRRKEGIPYITMHSPERADQTPIDKFLNDIFKR